MVFMKKRQTTYRVSLAAITGLICCSFVHAQEASEGEKLFALKVKSILVEKCLACHGSDPNEILGGLDLRTKESVLAGGESFGHDVLIPGKAKSSYLYLVTTREEEGFEMPPKEADKLTQEQAWAIRDWINQGAPWPNEQRVEEIRKAYAKGVTVKTSGGQSSEWTNRRYDAKKLWAYRPLNAISVPKNVHPIDWLLQKDLDRLNLSAAKDAPAKQIVRRISFGLTGLPPTPKQVTVFSKSYRESPGQAIDSYVDQLLESPHYGEHFGRQWLDVVRYADSAGFANDYARPNAWRFRDYVIRSFNKDLPFNQFVQQQIAGDELDDTNPEFLVATGFLRMGPWEHTSMSVAKVTRQQWLDDITDSVGQTFLAHPLQCAKCHDHKFDPVPTRDYYSMMAFFSTTQFAERKAPFSSEESQLYFTDSNAWTQAKIDAYQIQRSDLAKLIQANEKREKGDVKTGDNGLSPGDEASYARLQKNITRHQLESFKTQPIAFSVYTGATFGNQKNYKAPRPMPKNRWGKKLPEQDTILNGGDVFSVGETVQPAPISAAVALGEMKVRTFPGGKGKRRLALARWIASQDNPLTARVIVNRVWSWHFGKGLAANPNNFGATGAAPTHPELLDYLANWFMQNDWSIKKLNRLILSSQAYRRDSIHPDGKQLSSKDPNNRTYAVFPARRLTAEEMRDAFLSVSGELNAAVGGIPCRPEINPEVAVQPRQIMGGTASVYEPDPKREQRNRRTIYTERIRGLRDPFMETFNQPGPDKSCELRETSTVTPQALTLLNSKAMQTRALSMAKRVLDEKSSEQQVIQRLFELALSRNPTSKELELCLAHWSESTKHETNVDHRSQKESTSISRTVMAEKTGQPYQFEEIRPAYESYEYDLQPSDVDPRLRGLAQVCLVLLNSNEFAYLD